MEGTKLNSHNIANAVPGMELTVEDPLFVERVIARMSQTKALKEGGRMRRHTLRSSLKAEPVAKTTGVSGVMYSLCKHRNGEYVHEMEGAKWPDGGYQALPARVRKVIEALAPYTPEAQKALRNKKCEQKQPPRNGELPLDGEEPTLRQVMAELKAIRTTVEAIWNTRG